MLRPSPPGEYGVAGPAASSRLRSLLLATVGFVVLFSLVVLAAMTWADREDAIREAHNKTWSASRLLQEHVRRTIVTADLALEGVNDRLRQQGVMGISRDAELWRNIRMLVGKHQELGDLRIKDAQGDVLLDSRQFPAPRLNGADRANFQAHRGGMDFHVGEMIHSRAPRKVFFTVSRRIGTKDRFDGVSELSIDTGYYRKFFDSLDLGSMGSIALFRLDGTMVVRFPIGDPGRKIFHSEIIRRAQAMESGTIETKSVFDGRPRIASFQHVANLPLFVVVTVDKGQALQGWRERAAYSGALVLLGLLCCAGLGAATQRSLSREDRGRRRLNLILTSASDAIIGIDGNGNVVFANPAASALTGYGNAELLGRHLHGVIHHSHADGTAYPPGDCPILQVVRSGVGHAGQEDIYWRKDGTSFPVEFACSPMVEDGRTEGAVLVFHDITERKCAEEALRRAIIAAEAASRAKSEFLSNVSHEIRTPMNAILGHVHLLTQGELSQAQGELARSIRRSAQSLLGIIDGILDLSRLEAGRLALERTEFRLTELMRRVEAVATAAREKGIGFSVLVGPEVPDNLVGDPLRLQQVLMQLTGNAVKFTSQGEVRITVAAAVGAGGRTILTFAVRDTGIGIGEEQRAHLFQAFSQGDGSSTRRYGGVGLGLAIASRLIELMGGRIDLDSEPGVGSEFRVTLAIDIGSGRTAPDPTEEGAAATVFPATMLPNTGRPGGIDLRDALYRFGGDMGLLQRFAAGFARDHADMAEKIAAALAVGDLAQVRELGHDLKGVAGNIGARALSSHADAVQSAALQNDQDGAEARLAPMRAEMARVLDDIARLEAPVPAAAPSALRLDREGLEVVLERLTRLLRDNNFAAAEELATLAPVLADWFDPLTLSALTSAVDSLDFPRAEELVRDAARDLGLSLSPV